MFNRRENICVRLLPIFLTDCGKTFLLCILHIFYSNKHSENHMSMRLIKFSLLCLQTGFCDASDVCCRFSDRRRAAPLFQDNDFAAASTSEVLTKEGYVVNVPSNQYLPSFPEQEFNPDASNDDIDRIRPATPSTQRPTPPPQRPTPPPQRPTPTPPPSRIVPKCQNGAPDSSYPDCCTNGGTGPYCCTNGANNPYCCLNNANNPECKLEVVEQPTSKPVTQPPYKPVTQPPQRPVTQPPQRPVTQSPPRVVPTTPRQPSYQGQPNQPRPSVVLQDQALPIVPSACAAAMNCTLIEYCTATGVISKTPVVLTEFQKTYRVPMTDCMILPSKELGKCCRDADYTDPWPVGRFGQYNADELNAVFDSGAYKPERQAAKRQVNNRVAPKNPAAAPTNQVVTRVSAPVIQQQTVQQPRPNREIGIAPIAPQQTSIQSSQTQSCGVRNYVSFVFCYFSLIKFTNLSNYFAEHTATWQSSSWHRIWRIHLGRNDHLRIKESSVVRR